MINLVGPSDGRYNKHLDSTVLVHLTYCKLFMPYLQRWSLILHFFKTFLGYTIYLEPTSHFTVVTIVNVWDFSRK